jgi:hypothetical protein
MKKDPILITRNYYIIFLQRENSNLPDGLFAKITSKGDIIVALDYKSTNNGHNLLLGRR